MYRIPLIVLLGIITQPGVRSSDTLYFMGHALTQDRFENAARKFLSRGDKILAIPCSNLDKATLGKAAHVASPSGTHLMLSNCDRLATSARGRFGWGPCLAEPTSSTQLEFGSMRAAELKVLLKSRGISVEGCFDKESLVELAEANRKQLDMPVVETPAVEKLPAWAGGDPVEQGPTVDAKASLILLHGFMDTANGMISGLGGPLVAMEGLRVIFPNAPTVDTGFFPMSSWIDAGAAMIDPQAVMRADDAMVEKPVHYIHSLVRREIARGVPANHIVIGGFSQGGMVAIRAALSFPDAALGGAVALSTFFGADSANVAAANQRLRVFVAHGKADAMVPPAEGQRIATCINRIAPSANVQVKMYEDMVHASCPEEVTDLRNFLESVVKTP